ncbi:MAG: Na+/H+ antiporter NhaC [Clostridiales Family XIII bacterium]|jgi:NhaC family Na+:H+ antiporter|nr:Na+/H+ antiporter NhaC [Clostridiales Family XIII bacterium]
MNTLRKRRAERLNKPPSLALSIVIVLFFATCFIIQLVQTGSPDVHMTMIFAAAFAIILLVIQGTTLEKIEEGIVHGCKIATISMMILMFIGTMIPAWIAAGTIPTLIFYGLKMISPSVFLLTALLVCAISTLATGTSWGTAATFGVVMMGIGHGLGVPAEWTAAAVVSGAIFGDSISPISDTVNLAAGACEVNVFKHLRALLCCSIPAIILTAVIFLIMGFRFAGQNINAGQVDLIMNGLIKNFNVDPPHAIISLVPLVLVIVMVKFKISALATIAASALSAMLMALLVQGYDIYEMMRFMNYGFTIDSGIADIDTLMNRGGLQSMMWTVSLGYLGLSYGGILEKAGVLDSLLFSAKRITQNMRNLILTHTFTGFITIMLTASPYVSILIPGRMFIAGYDKLGINKVVASRTCETSGICLDPMLPWTLGGVFFSGALGVKPLDYAPFSFYLLITPVFAIFYALTGWFIPKNTDEENAAIRAKKMI